jgi:SAM-dependent methyltransferase
MQQESFKPISVKAPSSNRLLFAVRCFFDLQLKTIVQPLRPAMAKLQGTVIDVGAGESPWREWLPSTTRYQGVDIASAEEFGMQSGRPDITYYDGKTIPFDDASFDGALCIEVLEHADDPDKVISEIARCLKHGATLLLTVPWSARRHHLPYDFHRFTRERLLVLLSAHGFGQIEISERGTDISAIASKMVVLVARLLPKNIPGLWKIIPLALLAPIAIGFLIAAHVTEAIGGGAKEDPLGYFVQAVRK